MEGVAGGAGAGRGGDDGAGGVARGLGAKMGVIFVSLGHVGLEAAPRIVAGGDDGADVRTVGDGAASAGCVGEDGVGGIVLVVLREVLGEGGAGPGIVGAEGAAEGVLRGSLTACLL